MIIFNADLDNTLIYSYRHDIGKHKICVEIYQGREISFMTEQSYELLKYIRDKVLFVPTTTRTVAQYSRIEFGMEIPEYALVCNGGVLLVNGQPDEIWYQESLQIISGCQEELKKAEKFLEGDENREFEVRNISSLFIFTKSGQPDKTSCELKKILDVSLVDVFCNGVKVYVVPKKLSKGTAIRRLRERLKPAQVIAAGDSEFDISMMLEADVGIAPEKLAAGLERKGKIISVGDGEIFSEYVLEYVGKYMD